MKYNRLGVTDISISAVSLGGAPFSNSIYGPVNEEVTKDVIHAALDAGINYIDTAFWYGQGTSETAIGKALAGVPRQRYSIATKIGLYFPEKERMLDYSAERTLKQVNEALNRLQLPYLDVMQVHEVEWAPNEDVVLSECLPALQKAKEAGKIRYIGITSYSLDAVRNIVEKSRVKIDTVLSYCRGCMFDETLLDHLAFFKARNIGVINGACTGMGLLTPQGPPPWHVAKPLLRNLCDRARNIAQANLVSVARLAIKHSYGIPADSHLIGANSVEMLQENIRTYNDDLSTSEEQISKEIQPLFGESPRHNWEDVWHPGI